MNLRCLMESRQPASILIAEKRETQSPSTLQIITSHMKAPKDHCNKVVLRKEVEHLDSLITPWYEEYSSCFTLCSVFGWDFKERSKELLTAFASTQEKHGITIEKLREWVRLTERDTIHGTIPVPDFSGIA